MARRKTILLFIFEATLPMLLFLFLAFVDEHNIIIEDQFITLRYARNLARGAGPVFNVGERVEGFSSPLWVFIHAPAFRAGLDIFTYNRVLCIIFGLAHFPILSLIMRKYDPSLQRGAVRIFPSIILALSFPFLFWTKSGMETVLASLLLLSGSGLLAFGRLGAGSLLMGLFAITRPEGIIYMPVAAVIFMLDKNNGSVRDYSRAILPGATIFILYVVFRIFYFGDWLPNSFYAKVSVNSLHQKWQGVQYYLQWILGMRGAALILSLILLLRARELLARAGPWIFIIVMNAVFILAVGGDYMPHFRFIVVSLPAAAIVIGLGIMSLCSHEYLRQGPLWRAMSGFLVLIFALVLHPDTGRHLKAAWYAMARPEDLPVAAAGAAQHWKDLWHTRPGQPNRFVGEWTANNLSPGEKIAMDQCGLIPYLSNAWTVDVLGIMTPAMTGIPANQKPSLLMSMDIKYMLLIFSIDPVLPTFLPELLTREDFRKKYSLKAIFASKNYRRGSPGYLLFERTSELTRETYRLPRLQSDDEIIDWLGSVIKDNPLLVCWDYSDDVFR